MLATRSARRGTFVLSSGRTSNLYIDARLTTMSPDGLELIGRLGLSTIEREFGDIDAVGGLTLGADPVAYAIAHESARTSHPVRAFTVRKEAKVHGAGRQIEGPFSSGDRVVVIEDVITTGGSALRAVDTLRSAGADVRGVLAVVDRMEGGRENIEHAGLRVIALTQAPQILEQLPAP
jgi:orotate phosphoribosyltransferase